MAGYRKLGRPTDQRRAMLRSLVTSFLKYGKIETTETRAKEARSLAEKMITLAKKCDLHSRRQVLAFVQEEAVVKKITELAAEAKARGEQVGIIATDETKDRYPEGLVVSIGSRKEEETIAHHLYEVLRDFDQSAVKSIYSEAFYTPRMGQAIMNRLLKAAGHKIIQVV